MLVFGARDIFADTFMLLHNKLDTGACAMISLRKNHATIVIVHQQNTANIGQMFSANSMHFCFFQSSQNEILSDQFLQKKLAQNKIKILATQIIISIF